MSQSPQVQQRFQELFGWSFPPARQREFEEGLHKAATAWGYASIHDFSNWLCNNYLSAADRDRLVPFFSVGETYFFRDTRVFDYLEQHFRTMPPPGRPLRCWSAACSTGEEAYSLAVVLGRTQMHHHPHSQVIATDLNPLSLQKARTGVYSNWSFRDCPQSLKDVNFSPCEGGWQVRSHLQQRVSFQSINLATDIFPCSRRGLDYLDVIFCRNVLMYLAEPEARRVIRQLRECLRPGGLLFLSPTDSFFLDDGLLTPIMELGSTGYVRQDPGYQVELVPTQLFEEDPPAWLLEPTDPEPALHSPTRTNAARWRRKALEYQDRGHDSEALKAVLASLALDAWDTMSNYLIGDLYQAQGDEVRARRHFQRALESTEAMPINAVIEDSEFSAGQLAQMIRIRLMRLKSGAK